MFSRRGAGAEGWALLVVYYVFIPRRKSLLLVKAGKAGVDGGQILLYLLFGEKNDFREMIPESILGGEGDRKF